MSAKIKTNQKVLSFHTAVLHLLNGRKIQILNLHGAEAIKLFVFLDLLLYWYFITTKIECSDINEIYFQPWAAELEREMKPAMDRVEERLGSALDDLGFSFGNERIDSHVMDTTGKQYRQLIFRNIHISFIQYLI